LALTTEPPLPQPRWKKVLLAVGVLVFALGAGGFGMALYLTHKFSGRQRFVPLQTVGEMAQMAALTFNPQQAFPHRHRINLLCMGLDRNWTRDNMPYTKDARTDTMMVASLDLEKRSVAVLSIPRDTWVQMPGSRGMSKINDAHSRGGIPYAVQTVEDLLEAPIDYYVVIKQEAVQGAIDRIGGLQLDVEKDMDYDDKWGHLHIHLKKGDQRLNGEQVVGYMRFRHDEEADFGRIRRQQQVVQTLSSAMKSPTIIFRLGELFDVLNEHVKTNLRREQIMALGKMFHHVRPEDLLTAQLPGEAVMRNGAAIVEPDEEKKELLVDWLLRGNQEAANKLISVEVVNESGKPRLAERTVYWLRSMGFQAWNGGSGRFVGRKATEVVERGSLPHPGQRVLASLGLAGSRVNKDSTRRGGATVRLLLGKDAATSPVLQLSDRAGPRHSEDTLGLRSALSN
jgi:LCP family protein required for cell wall assembly